MYLDGQRIRACYLGYFPITGTVTMSRVGYGGIMHHYVDLDAPIDVFGAIRNQVVLTLPEMEGIAMLSESNTVESA